MLMSHRILDDTAICTTLRPQYPGGINMQEKTTNRHKSAVSLMVTLTTIITALLTFITVSKSVPGETVTSDYRG